MDSLQGSQETLDTITPDIGIRLSMPEQESILVSFQTFSDRLGDLRIGGVPEIASNWLDPDFFSSKVSVLTEVFSRLARAVIDGALEKLHVLSNMYVTQAGKLRLKKISNIPLNDRFGGENIAEKMENFRINAVLTDSDQIQGVIGFLATILTDLRNEMEKNSTFQCLKEAIVVLENVQTDEERLLGDLKRSKKVMRYLRGHVIDRRANLKAVLKQMDVETLQLKGKNQDVREKLWMEQHYLRNWQNARKEQNKILLTEKEDVHKNVISNSDQNIEDENIIHDDIKLFTSEMTKDYYNEIQKWMDRYETEMESLDNEIVSIKVKSEKLTDNLEALHREYNRRKQAIEDYLEHKRLKKEEEERARLETWAATKIQAWWRGVMVRKKLGPYRKKKGKKGKDKNKKGKNKKK